MDIFLYLYKKHSIYNADNDYQRHIKMTNYKIEATYKMHVRK